MSDYQDANKLAKALTAIKASDFQIRAAALLLQAVGLKSALEFVAEMAKLNAMRAAKEADNGSS